MTIVKVIVILVRDASLHVISVTLVKDRAIRHASGVTIVRQLSREG